MSGNRLPTYKESMQYWIREIGEIQSRLVKSECTYAEVEEELEYLQRCTFEISYINKKQGKEEGLLAPYEV